MTMVTVPGGPLILPEFYSLHTAPLVTSFWGATASGHRVAAIVRVPKTGTLDTFEWMCHSYTATNTVRSSFQDVDLATGNPDGVVDQYRTGTPTSATWVAPGLITADGTDGGGKRSVTRGDLLACVVDFSAYTSGSVNVRVAQSNSIDQHVWVPTYNGTTWTKNGGYTPLLALKYDDGTYAVLQDQVWPLTAITTTALNTGTTPDEAGLRFQVPFDCVVEGVNVYMEADGDCTIVLYDAADAVLATVSFDKDVRHTTAAAAIYPLPLSAAVTLTRDTTYRLVVKPTSATTCNIYDATVASVALMAAIPGGAAWHWTQRTDAGAWTDTTTRRPLAMGLRIGQVDDGDGAGAGADTATGSRFNRSFN